MSLPSVPAPVPGGASLFGLDPTFTNLNHGSVGAVPLTVRNRRRLITDELEHDPRGFFKSRVRRVTAARHAVAGLVGADPELTAFVTNVTTGSAVVLHSLGLRSGDEVVTTIHGYGAIGFNVDAYAPAGVVHKVADMPLIPTDDEVVDGILAQVTDRTRLVICDHITSATARLFPIARIAAELRSRGVPLLVDAAHVPGHIPADVTALGADFWVGNLHKWAFAPRGSALLTVAPEWKDRIRPLVISWENEAGYPVAVEYNGTDDWTNYLAAPAGVELLDDLGPELVAAHNRRLAHYGLSVLSKALNVETPDAGPSELAMRLVFLPEGVGDTQEKCARIEQAVRDELRTELTVNSFGGTGTMRVAAQIYNTPADYERLADRLPALLHSLT
ncbi:aminotransferase class V-fold PLP-dependent enzyme [Phytomonospora endophytica]|uniref:Isopenicillin-N epimerase n=1 Tax=Phytomonospora endophytica TaxID=714109 RepID=A0A841F9U3_9ACTN|nr:aminotransferase class V-fold PLP-dependent enzyme [Phytomonospora endophytica]MBB6032504.1 isopenicillin-N epimerase [Phytomonospora endophytica]GIG66348.1 aminotransferase class V [Phytomonospora endophytica]